MTSPEIGLKPFVDGDSPALCALVNANRAQLAKFWWEAATQDAGDSRRFIKAQMSHDIVIR